MLRPVPPHSYLVRLLLLSGSVIGKGVVMNVSCTGLRVLGDHSLTPGTDVSIRVAVGRRSSPGNFPGHGPLGNEYEFGLRIDHAHVSRGRSSGRSHPRFHRRSPFTARGKCVAYRANDLPLVCLTLLENRCYSPLHHGSAGQDLDGRFVRRLGGRERACPDPLVALWTGSLRRSSLLQGKVGFGHFQAAGSTLIDCSTRLTSS